MKYLTKIYWSEEDAAYVAIVPALRGCISHGETMEEAAANIREAAEAWLESAGKHHDEIPAPDLASEELSSLSAVINLSKLAQIAGLNKHTLSSKLRRHTKFTPEESEKILTALHGF